MKISIGRIVLYTLSEQDAVEINRRRTTREEIAKRIKRSTLQGETHWPLGAQAHIGSAAHAGDIFPMIVVNVNEIAFESVNGQVFLDGNDCLWVKEVTEGLGSGKWFWPPVVK